MFPHLWCSCAQNILEHPLLQVPHTQYMYITIPLVLGTLWEVAIPPHYFHIHSTLVWSVLTGLGYPEMSQALPTSPTYRGCNLRSLSGTWDILGCPRTSLLVPHTQHITIPGLECPHWYLGYPGMSQDILTSPIYTAYHNPRSGVSSLVLGMSWDVPKLLVTGKSLLNTVIIHVYATNPTSNMVYATNPTINI